MKNEFRALYMDVHILQMLPPSNANRGEMGEPKTATIGGTTRTRISSQAQKRAARLYLMSHGADGAIRTRATLDEIQKRLVSKGMEEDKAKELAAKAAKDSGIVSSRSDAKDTLTFLSDAQYDAVADVSLKAEKGEYADDKEYKNAIRNAVMDQPSADELLFGRMFASEPSLNYDAASQVMNAFSVNQVKYEFDYFTAVDDIVKNQGSAHMESKMFTDPLLYRYANVNLSETSELIRYNKDGAAEIASMFAEAFIRSMPSGASNAFANVTLPSYVMIVLRDDQPVNFAPAFLTAVKGEDYLAEAVERLEQEADRISSNYGAPVFVEKLGDKPLKEMLADMKDVIAGRI